MFKSRFPLVHCLPSAKRVDEWLVSRAVRSCTAPCVEQEALTTDSATIVVSRATRARENVVVPGRTTPATSALCGTAHTICHKSWHYFVRTIATTRSRRFAQGTAPVLVARNFAYG